MLRSIRTPYLLSPIWSLSQVRCGGASEQRRRRRRFLSFKSMRQLCRKNCYMIFLCHTRNFEFFINICQNLDAIRKSKISGRYLQSVYKKLAVAISYTYFCFSRKFAFFCQTKCPTAKRIFWILRFLGYVRMKVQWSWLMITRHNFLLIEKIQPYVHFQDFCFIFKFNHQINTAPVTAIRQNVICFTTSGCARAQNCDFAKFGLIIISTRDINSWIITRHANWINLVQIVTEMLTRLL